MKQKIANANGSDQDQSKQKKRRWDQAIPEDNKLKPDEVRKFFINF